ncbi:MAG TPA: phosphatase PAP2-related protein [Candidatus Limnocylindria bacterium]|nr:phosphatase PAP2-related protein [Candidatus Limnocylindria bacterium]
MSKIFHRYRALKSHKVFYLQLATGLLLMCLALFFNNYANNYTSLHSGATVNDIILDNVPTVNVELIFVEGMLGLIVFVIFLSLHRPARIPFILKTCALFIATRAFFFILTHLGVPANMLELHPTNFLERVIAGSGAGLFFSGHTGFPFLWAMIFWENLRLRIAFFIASAFFGIVVLLGHLHYSIDVFSSVFIAYGVYHIAIRLFKKDFRLFEESL